MPILLPSSISAGGPPLGRRCLAAVLNLETFWGGALMADSGPDPAFTLLLPGSTLTEITT